MIFSSVEYGYTAPQDEVRRRCRYGSNFEIVELADTPLGQPRGHAEFVEQRAGARAG